MSKKGTDLYFVHYVIMLALIACGWLLPAGEVITPMGMKAVGIFAGLIYGWIFIDLIWPSLLGLVLISFTGYGTLTGVFGEGFGSEIVLLIIFFSVFTKWLEDIGLTNSIAQWMLSRKFLAGKPYLFLFVIFLVTYVVSACVGIYATIFLMWGICYQMLLNLGYAKREKLTSFVLIGVAYVSIMGMTVIPWSPWSLMGLKGLATASGMTIGMLRYSIFMLVIALVSVVLFMLMGKFIVKIDVSKLKNVDALGLGDHVQFDGKQKLGGILTVLMMVLLYAPGILSAGWSVAALFKSLGALGVIVLLIVLLCAYKTDGEPTMNFTKATAAIPWSMVCLLAAVGPLGSLLMSNDAGIIKALMMTLQPIFVGQSPIMIYIISAVICCVATQFLNNTVLLVVLTPLLCQMSIMFNANPAITAAVVIFGLTAALATPGASSRAGLVFGNNEWIDTKQAYLQGVLSVVAVLAALIVIGIPLGGLLF